MKNTTVADTVSAILDQAGLDDRFRADFTRLVASVWDAGAASSAVVYKSVPLTDAEIAAVRAKLQA
jgi:hypothetical protein